MSTLVPANTPQDVSPNRNQDTTTTASPESSNLPPLEDPIPSHPTLTPCSTEDQDIWFFCEALKFDLPHPDIIREWIRQTMKSEDKKLIHVNYIFCNDRYLHKINLFYVREDALTDILTFDFTDDKGSLFGDIFISVERVRENAQEMDINFYNELCRVMIHGVLHLTGYDDQGYQEEAVMRAREERALAMPVLRDYLKRTQDLPMPTTF